jgi:hypothetical protein
MLRLTYGEMSLSIYWIYLNPRSNER